MQVVQILADQLEASLTFRSEEGARVVLTWRPAERSQSEAAPLARAAGTTSN
jgi:hypothetical protein